MYMLGEMKTMYETEKGYLNVNSTMSDASKRRLSEDAKEAEGEASISDWSTCGFEGPSKVENACLVGALKPPTEKPYMLHVHRHINPPEKNMTFSLWGNSVCQMPKVAELKLSYLELIQLASTDTEIKEYLMWVKNRYGTENTGNPKGKITPAVDLAMFLEAVDWNGDSMVEKGSMTFSRKLKD
jgi:hypothetical protein